MKKILLLSSIVLLFTGCALWLKDSTIINESSYNITFKAKKADRVTVNSGKSITIQNDIGAELEYFESDIPKRVDYMQTEIYKGKFFDLSSIPVIINNTMLKAVTLSAGGYFDIDPIVDIPIGESNANIFIRKPVLTVTTNSFPAIANYQIVDNIMYIIIK